MRPAIVRGVIDVIEIRTQACQSVDSINVHRAASADSLSAAPSECQGRIDFILDPNQCVQHHWPRLVKIQGVGLHSRLGGRLVGVPSVDLEGLDLGTW
jgi:hypothetical protein